jgi:polyhydroxybutyrate depolymerase
MNFVQSLLLALGLITSALPSSDVIKLDVNGTERMAIVEAPDSATAKAAPVVFAFHGHGGNSRNSQRTFRMAEAWPEAIVVYPQGLKISGRSDPDGARPGWQHAKGQVDDRDLKFVDALLKELHKRYRIDDKHIFSMGHSNGGEFSYLLMEERPNVFAGFAPSSSAAPRPAEGTKLVGKPVFYLGGTTDPLVPFAAQQKTVDIVKRLGACSEKAETWAPNCLYYSSPKGAPVATYITDVGHVFQRDAVPFIVRFFKSL